jgi:8-oxo-dGTP pyrophosphatase MutT (NUDIX family)
MILSDIIRDTLVDPNIATHEVGAEFFKKLKEDGYSRDENPISHFVVYFTIYNPASKQVFITHHKKSGEWLFPGGHLDKGESPAETLTRELREELGLIYEIPVHQKPFLLTITHIDTANYACKTHFDVWYAIPTDGKDFQIDPSEFHATKWLSPEEARALITDEPNLEALAWIETMMK